MRISNEVFAANNGANLFLDHDGYDEHKWSHFGHEVSIVVYSNDATEAFLDIFINGCDGSPDGSEDGYIGLLEESEFDDLSAIVLSGDITSSDVLEIVGCAVERGIEEFKAA